MATIVGGFTQDVISLVTIAGNPGSQRMRQMVRDIQSPEERAKFLREGLVDVLSPVMQKTPPFVQQIVARAIVDHVDWDAVAKRLLVVPENN
jgi:hypothetical protein